MAGTKNNPLLKNFQKGVEKHTRYFHIRKKLRRIKHAIREQQNDKQNHDDKEKQFTTTNQTHDIDIQVIIQSCINSPLLNFYPIIDSSCVCGDWGSTAAWEQGEKCFDLSFESSRVIQKWFFFWTVKIIFYMPYVCKTYCSWHKYIYIASQYDNRKNNFDRCQRILFFIDFTYVGNDINMEGDERVDHKLYLNNSTLSILKKISRLKMCVTYFEF